ncbi:hypothetical protein BX666DRAFT_1882009 [Dichotomocladium elegans]|nr:hypothetical protein BX666DRAFT_1882009 [Dichotomocladium elegans]
MLHGGICRAIVRGTRHTAAVHEAGWSSRSNQYLSVTWMMCEQGPDDEEESIHQDSPNETLLSDDEEMAESDKFEDAAEKTESESMPPATQPPVSPEKDNGNGNMRKRSPEELNGITKKARVEVEESNSNSAT